MQRGGFHRLSRRPSLAPDLIGQARRNESGFLNIVYKTSSPEGRSGGLAIGLAIVTGKGVAFEEIDLEAAEHVLIR